MPMSGSPCRGAGHKDGEKGRCGEVYKKEKKGPVTAVVSRSASLSLDSRWILMNPVPACVCDLACQHANVARGREGRGPLWAGDADGRST